MDIAGLGPLTLDEDVGWYYSGPVSSSTLRGTTGRLVIDASHLADGIPDDLPAAGRAFLAGDDSALVDASDHVLAYYLDVAREAEEQGWDLAVLEIADAVEVWEHVELGAEWHLDRCDGVAYVSVECECAWEPEHGLQLVFRGGRTITKVGPYDGHLTNAAAYDRPDLAGVVYVSLGSL